MEQMTKSENGSESIKWTEIETMDEISNEHASIGLGNGSKV